MGSIDARQSLPCPVINPGVYSLAEDDACRLKGDCKRILSRTSVAVAAYDSVYSAVRCGSIPVKVTISDVTHAFLP